MAKKRKKEEVVAKDNSQNDSKTFAFLATFLSIIGFIIALVTKKDDEYVMYYAKQSLVIFVVYVIATIIMMIPVLGWILGPIIYVLATILWLISWINALSGEEKKIPIVSDYAEKIKL